MARDIICGIYKITSPSNKIYIGQSKDIYKRWTGYNCKRGCPEQKKLHSSFLKYGIQNHKFEIMETCSKENINEREIFYVDLLKSCEFGLNLSKGGMSSFTRRKHSKETKDIIRKKLIGRIKSPEEIEKVRIQNIGQKRSDESKEKMRQAKLKIKDELSKIKKYMWKNFSDERKSEISEKIANKLRGVKQSAETISKRALRNTGKKRTEESKKKISKGNKGKIRTEETKEKLRLGWIKRKNKYPTSEETKRKMSENRKGKKVSEETKKKISDTKIRIRQERLMMIF